MAKVKMPLMSAEVRGALGGIVFNTWKGINYVKTNTSPTGQGTAKRLAAQALLIQVSQLWKGLTDPNRAAWAAYAAAHPVTDWTGAPKHLTGQNWFVKLTTQLLRLGNAAVDTPPVVNAPDALTAFTVGQTSADLIAEWDAPLTATLNIELWTAGPLSKGIACKIEQCQFLLSTGCATAQPLHAVVGAPIGRHTVFARVIDTVTGLVSNYQSAFVDIT